MAEIVITEFMDPAGVAELGLGRSAVYDPGLVDRPDALLAHLGDCRALVVRNRTQVRGAVLDAAPGLRVVGRLGVGLDNIDLAACLARGIEVLPARGANDLAVAEYVVTAALVLLRGAWLATPELLAGRWPRERLVGRELAGKTMGLVGMGAIARAVAVRVHALGMRTAAFDAYVAADDPVWLETAKHDSLDTLLAAADVVSLHVPLSAETRRLIGQAALTRMRPDAFLINTSRGGVVDEGALARALREGRIGGAALDVFESEPLDAGAAGVFADCPNLVLTPHIAGVTVESNERVSAVTAANVLEVLARLVSDPAG